MSNINNGGPAFPTDTDRASRGVVPGMTLRDYFAAHAMSAGCFPIAVGDYPGVATAAYKMADAMLAARAQRGESFSMNPKDFEDECAAMLPASDAGKPKAKSAGGWVEWNGRAARLPFPDNITLEIEWTLETGGRIEARNAGRVNGLRVKRYRIPGEGGLPHETPHPRSALRGCARRLLQGA